MFLLLGVFLICGIDLAFFPPVFNLEGLQINFEVSRPGLV
jgi:hypothetical protein